MKKNIAILLLCIAVVFYCCNDGKKKPTTPSTPPVIQVQDTVLFRDTFNLPSNEEMGSVNRPVVEEEIMSRRVPKKPTQPTPIPTIPTSDVPVILLDFDGHYLSGTSWNWNGDINCSNSGLMASEMQVILDSFTSKFSPYIVKVTTDENAYNAAPIAKRMRVIFTTSWEWFGQAGGVAYKNSYTWANNTPCFVFTSLLNYNPKYLAGSGIHESLHTLGLDHQSVFDSLGNYVSEYNKGGCGTYAGCGFAPVMGYPYGQPDFKILSVGKVASGQIVNEISIISSVIQKR